MDFGVKNIIVTRHAGAAEWLKEKCMIDAQIVNHIESADSIVEGARYFGIFPLNLAEVICRKGGKVIGIALPNLPAEWRGKELTPDQMVQAGAKLVRYHIQELPLEL